MEIENCKSTTVWENWPSCRFECILNSIRRSLEYRLLHKMMEDAFSGYRIWHDDDDVITALYWTDTDTLKRADILVCGKCASRWTEIFSADACETKGIFARMHLHVYDLLNEKLNQELMFTPKVNGDKIISKEVVKLFSGNRCLNKNQSCFTNVKLLL